MKNKTYTYYISVTYDVSCISHQIVTQSLKYLRQQFQWMIKDCIVSSGEDFPKGMTSENYLDIIGFSDFELIDWPEVVALTDGLIARYGAKSKDGLSITLKALYKKEPDNMFEYKNGEWKESLLFLAGLTPDI